MPHKQSNLERQLTHAQQDLDARADALAAQEVAADARRRDAIWRQLNARCAQLRGRIRAAAAIVALDEEVKQRKNQPPPEKKAKGKPKGKAKAKAAKKDGGKKPKAGGGTKPAKAAKAGKGGKKKS